MDTVAYKSSGLKTWVRRICFMIIGVCALTNPMDFFNIYNILFGLIIGLFFGFLYRRFLGAFLDLFNHQFKKERGKAVIKEAVEMGMLFLTPFTIMLLLATFGLRWSMTLGFISAGIMSVGTASAIEMGKIKGKQEIKNTIATSGVSFLFAIAWTLSIPLMTKVPPYIEGGINLIRSLAGGGGFGL